MNTVELTGDTLTEACLKALEWRRIPLLGNGWLLPGGTTLRDYIPETASPELDTSLDDCLHYLWPELQRRGWTHWGVGLETDTMYRAYVYKIDWPEDCYIEAFGSTPAEAFCRAYLATVEADRE